MLGRWLRFRKYAVLLLVAVVSVTLLAVERRRPGERLWLADVVAAITTPTQIVVSHAHRGATDLWTRYLGWTALRADASRLRAEVVALRLRQLQHAELEAENRRLRELASLRQRLPVGVVGAEVIAREWNGFARRLTINRGRAGGVERLAPVVVTRGLVGRVIQVYQESAVILPLTDPDSSVGAVVSRTRAQGLVEGSVGGGLRLKLPAREEGVTIGDLVVSSGTGGLFPRGLPLGRVSRLHAPGSLFSLADLEPAADLSSVEEVLVLRRGAREDLSVAFSGT